MPLSTPQHLKDEAVKLRQGGMSAVEIAKKLEIHERTVSRACQGNYEKPKYNRGKHKFAQMLSQCAADAKSKGYMPCDATVEELKERWGYSCEICGKQPKDLGRRSMCMDHCHKTGKFRGFICGPCNAGLGFAQDSSQILIAMAEYLIRSTQDAG